jgi:hypothetical protein
MRFRFWALALVLGMFAASGAAAQVQSGNISGTVTDEQGAVLPGVVVNLTSTDRTATFATGPDGRYRFLALPPGQYSVSFELPGFRTIVREQIEVRVGQNVELPVQMSVAAVQETVTVTGESPLIDTRAMGTSTNFTQDELARVPNSRDPWALLRTVPGVMLDRVNIAGNETGQQSEFVGKGATRFQSTWTLDGVVITDMAATGASPTYFDYDAFDEIQISTGGQDIRQPTGGVGLNFVVKRGTNQFRGTGRGYFTNDALEASNVPDELKQRGITPATADHNDQISDVGFDIGGPIRRDRAWFWGSITRQDIRLLRASGNVIDRTILDTTNLKFNWQVTSKDMFNFLWFNGAKKKYGRNPGNAQREPLSATWRQDNNYPDNPFHGLWKLENNRAFTSNLFATVRYAYYGTGFLLEPMLGTAEQAGISTRLGETFGSTQANYFLRPQHSANLEGSYFRNFMGGDHEIKFGGGWRRTASQTQTFWPGDMVVAFDNSLVDQRARLYREGLGTNRTEYFNWYVGDTMSLDRLTIDLGLRYDRQWGAALPSKTQSNKAFPNVVPGIDFPGYEAPFTWTDFSPRAGLTWAIDEARRTVARVSFSMFPGQLDAGTVGYMNPSASVGFVDYPWVDLNRDNLVQPNEVVFTATPITFGGGFNPAAPTSVRSANQIDPNLEANKMASFVVGVDRELMANLALQVNYSHTRGWDFTYTPWAGLTIDDYTPGSATVEGVQTFIPNATRVAANGNSRILTNYPGYSTTYNGVEVSVIKRMSNNWMMRLATSVNNPTEDYDVLVNSLGNPTPLDTSPLVRGGQFFQRSAGSGPGDIFVNGRWSFNLNGAYQMPWGVEVAGNLFGRQGNPYPHFRSVALGLDGAQRVLVTPTVDTERFENLWNLDLRLAKNIRVQRINAQLIGDVFNVMNNNAELQRERNAGSPNFRRLNQNLSPRILRIGARIGF